MLMSTAFDPTTTPAVGASVPPGPPSAPDAVLPTDLIAVRDQALAAAATQQWDVARKAWEQFGVSLVQQRGNQAPELVEPLRELAEIALRTEDWPLASALLTQAIQLCDHLLEGGTAPSPSAAISLGTLVDLLNAQAEARFVMNEPDAACAASERALRLLNAAAVPDPVRSLRVTNNLAAIHVVRGELLLAERLYRQSLDQLAATTSDPTAALPLLTNLAEVYRLRGQWTRAEQTTKRTLRQCLSSYSVAHPVTAQAFHQLAFYRQMAGRPQSARVLYRRAYELRRELFPAHHPTVLRSLRGLVEVCWQAGELLRTERLADAALQLIADYPDTPVSLVAAFQTKLGQVYTATGRLATAERLLQQALATLPANPASATDASQRSRSADFQSLVVQAATINVALGELHLARQQVAPAQTRFESARQTLESTLGPQHFELAQPLLGLGTTAIRQADWARAEQQFQAALALREQAFGANHPFVAAVQRHLAELALHQQQFSLAQSRAEQALRIVSTSPEPLFQELSALLGVLAEAARRNQQPDVALHYANQHLQLLDQRPETTASERMNVLLRLGQIALAAQQESLAHSQLTEGLRLAESLSGTSSSIEAQQPFLELLVPLSLRLQQFDAAQAFTERLLKAIERQFGPQSSELLAAYDQLLEWWQVAPQQPFLVDLEQRALTIRNQSAHVLLELF